MVTDPSADNLVDARQERNNRIRIGATGLASIVVIVLLAATFSGTASNEPELTPEAMAEQIQPDSDLNAEEELPQEPLAELGVAPGTGPVEETEAEPDPELVIEDAGDDS
jgi:type IV secretory pathway VirB10-like protein